MVPTIFAEIYKKNTDENGKSTGTASYVRPVTYGEIMHQFKTALRAIPYEDCKNGVLGAAEYTSFYEYDQDKSKAIPKGELIVIPRYGHCEGVRIELAVQCSERNHALLPLVSVKLFTDSERLWEISRQIYEACHQGLFEVADPETIKG